MGHFSRIVGLLLLIGSSASGLPNQGLPVDDDKEQPPHEPWELGRSFCQIGDLNADGVADLVIQDDWISAGHSKITWKKPWRLLAISGLDGTILWSTEKGGMGTPHASSDSLWPVSVNAWTDWDGDRVPDVLCVWRDSTNVFQGPWGITVFSGKTGELIACPELPDTWQKNIVWSGSELGARDPANPKRGYLLQRLTGLDGDEVWGPVVLGKPIEWQRLRLLSFDHESSKVVAEITAPEGEVFCSRAEWIQGPHVGEVWGLACLTKLPGTEEASLRVLRFRHEEHLSLEWKWIDASGLKLTPRTGISAVNLGDVDEDGVSDIAVALRRLQQPGEVRRVLVLNGATGMVMTEIGDHGEGQQSFGCAGEKAWGCGFASSLAVIGDIDQDGSNELVIGSNATNMNSGSILLLNPRTGEVISSHQAEFEVSSLGTQIYAGLDFDRDGVPDLVAGEAVFNNGKNEVPRVHLFSGRSFKPLRQFP